MKKILLIGFLFITISALSQNKYDNYYYKFVAQPENSYEDTIVKIGQFYEDTDVFKRFVDSVYKTNINCTPAYQCAINTGDSLYWNFITVVSYKTQKISEIESNKAVKRRSEYTQQQEIDIMNLIPPYNQDDKDTLIAFLTNLNSEETAKVNAVNACETFECINNVNIDF